MQPAGFRDLILNAQAGDPTAIERLFQEVLPFVEGLVRAGGVRPGDSVSDHAQNTCQRILIKLNQFDGAQQATDDEQVLALFRAWVRIVAHTVKLNSTRRRGPRQPVVSLQSPGADDSTEGPANDPPGREPAGSANVRAEERAQLIQEAINTLPDATDREVLRRRFFEEQTLEVIATELTLTYDQARERCRKSMKRLQRRLEGLL
jgi:RNA polymerase sigma factor (sigma-70 family)